MTLETLKKLRARGASVQMQEDLASFLDGGFDSELFLPTIDFILTLKNPPRSQQQDIEQSQSVDLSDFDIPQVYDAKYFEKISIKAAGQIIKSSVLEENLRQEILAYLDNMEIQRAQQLGILGGEEPETIEFRAKISNSKRSDRGTKNVKSMFEVLVSGLSALQVRVSQQNALKKAAQEKTNKSSRIQSIIAQRLQHHDVHEHGHHGEEHGKMAKAEKNFLKRMRRALRPNKNNDNEGNDSQQGRIGGKDVEKHQDGKAVSDVAHKYDQAQESAAKSADDYKAPEHKKNAQVAAAKGIHETKNAEEATKQAGGDGANAEKTKTEQKTRNTNLQMRLQRTRMRIQRMRDDALHQEQAHSRHGKIDNHAAEKAVRALKNMGVSLGDSDMVKLNSKELSQVDKLHEKQRG